jgi:acetyltransferase-like isoleucine patch superfamily enzyme
MKEKEDFIIRREHEKIRIGKLTKHASVVIHPKAQIELTGDLKIGKFSYIGDDVKIFTHKHIIKNSRKRRVKSEQIVPVNLEIGEDVAIAANSLIIAVSIIGMYMGATTWANIKGNR